MNITLLTKCKSLCMRKIDYKRIYSGHTHNLNVNNRITMQAFLSEHEYLHNIYINISLCY